MPHGRKKEKVKHRPASASGPQDGPRAAPKKVTLPSPAAMGSVMPPRLCAVMRQFSLTDADVALLCLQRAAPTGTRVSVCQTSAHGLQTETRRAIIISHPTARCLEIAAYV